jgi:hypothetical protein
MDIVNIMQHFPMTTGWLRTASTSLGLRFVETRAFHHMMSSMILTPQIPIERIGSWGKEDSVRRKPEAMQNGKLFADMYTHLSIASSNNQQNIQPLPWARSQPEQQYRRINDVWDSLTWTSR